MSIYRSSQSIVRFCLDREAQVSLANLRASSSSVNQVFVISPIFTGQPKIRSLIDERAGIVFLVKDSNGHFII
jgi:hypothetical protein